MTISLGSRTSSQSFVRPQFSVTSADAAEEEGRHRSVPNLIEHNARRNPDHLFCLQYGHNLHAAPKPLTMTDLHDAVLRFCGWLASRGLAQTPKIVDGKVVKSRPIAILMASDVGWFIAFAALLRLGIPVLCMSARLSPQAVVHLVRVTGTQALLVSPQLDDLVAESGLLFESDELKATAPGFHQVPLYTEYLDRESPFTPDAAPEAWRHVDNHDRNVMILHSSGTTGLPKPIFHSAAYPLGYAAAHKLSPPEVENTLNVSTMPLFHGFGLLAPSLALSIGMPFALPASTTIPTGSSTYEILQSSHATSLMTVPSILEEIFLLDARKGIDALKRLKFVAVGGAAMKHTIAKPLADAGVPILNHWGVTEIGAIAHIFIPDASYDWHYLRVRDDMDLRFEPLNNTEGQYRLVGCPPLTGEPFFVQDFLDVNPFHPTSEFRIAGRADDLIVLANGEKILPVPLEQSVSEDPRVRGAVAFGDGRFQIGLIIEAATHVDLDLTNSVAVQAYIDSVWPNVEKGNEVTDHHGRVSREMIIVTTPSAQPLTRTPKGSIPRKENVQIFQEHVDRLYERADMADAEALPMHDQEALRESIRKAVLATYKHKHRALTDSDDFFERGMDSLQATMLRRRLVASLALTLGDEALKKPVPVDIVYANPSVDMLYRAVKALCSDESEQVENRIARIRAVAEEYVSKVSSLLRATSLANSRAYDEARGAVVLLTGSTGNLGSAILYELVASPDVAVVYTLNRGGSHGLQERQEDGLKKLGVELGEGWKKVILLEAELGDVRFGLGEESYHSLRSVTHIIHNAWPMDFNRTLTSFIPHLDAAKSIIQLALDSTSTAPVRIIFSSSIAVVGRYPLASSSTSPVPEEPLLDPAAIDHFGYAEAKWVCEQMFEAAAKTSGFQIAATSVRIGQMTGAESTGAWNVAEHIPMIVKSSIALRCMPDIPGTASWIPVDKAAKVMSELLLSPISPQYPVLHLENPVRQPWQDILQTIASALSLPQAQLTPYTEWLGKVQILSDPQRNPCVKILPFLQDEFLRMASGDVVLATTETKRSSPTLSGMTAVEEEVVRQYVAYWKGVGYL